MNGRLGGGAHGADPIRPGPGAGLPHAPGLRSGGASVRRGARTVRLESVKWGDLPHRSWDRLWELAPGPETVLWGPRGTSVHEADGRVWVGPKPVLIHFWPDRDYNVVTLIEPAGPPRFYCNVCLPARLIGSRRAPVWRYVDLDLDVVVLADGTAEVRDEKEFLTNAERYGYPPEVRRRAEAGLAALQALVRARGGPFAPGSVERWLPPRRGTRG